MPMFGTHTDFTGVQVYDVDGAMHRILASDWLAAHVRHKQAAKVREAADRIQALHPGEVKNSVIWLREFASTIEGGGITNTDGDICDYCGGAAEYILLGDIANHEVAMPICQSCAIESATVGTVDVWEVVA